MKFIFQIHQMKYRTKQLKGIKTDDLKDEDLGKMVEDSILKGEIVFLAAHNNVSKRVKLHVSNYSEGAGNMNLLKAFFST